MQSRAQPFQGSMRVMALTLIAILGLVFLRAALVAPEASERIVTADNDSIMRLLSVRDWLNGQGWFDMNNYRVLPPEGLSLHWSRYVDLGIASVIGGLSLFMPYEDAEALALVVWPSLLLVSFLALITVMALRLYGPLAATIALLAVAFWRLLAYNHLGPMVIDHHGVQILLMTVVVFTLVIDGPELRRGIIGGGAAALSLAVGLENLLPIAAAGLVLAVLAVLPGDRGHRQLRAFGLSLAGFALPLHMGQTAPSAWTQLQCDELGPPMLGIVGVAAIASVAIAWAVARTPRLGIRLPALGATAVLAVAAVAWIMQACPDFPYGNLPVELRTLIYERIAEAVPAPEVIASADTRLFSHLLPTMTATLMATGIVAWRWRSNRAAPAELRSTAILLVFAWVGTAGIFIQVRMNVLSAPVIPLLIGYCIAALTDARQKLERPAMASLASIVVIAGALMPGQLHYAVSTISKAHASTPTASGNGAFECHTVENIAGLNALPRGRVLASLNLSMSILIGSHHDVLAGPYHRSADAFGNGFTVVLGDEAEFYDLLERSQPDYLVLCPDARYGDEDAFVNAFLDGERVEGFTPVEGLETQLLVLEVAR